MPRVWVFYSPGNLPVYIIHLKNPGKKERKDLLDKEPVTALLRKGLYDKVSEVLRKNGVRRRSIAVGIYDAPKKRLHGHGAFYKVMIPGPIGVADEFTKGEIGELEEIARIRETIGVPNKLKDVRSGHGFVVLKPDRRQ